MQKIGYTTAALAALCWLGTALAGDRGNVVEMAGFKSEAPAEWKAQPVSNRLRAYQFQLPRAAGDKEDAELAVFYFGPTSGGTVAQNLDRWKKQFEPAAGGKAEESAKVEELKVGDVPVTYADLRGTYLASAAPFAPNAKATRKENYRRLVVIFESEKGPYFITVTGPARTVEQHKPAFDRWLKGFK